MQRGIEEGMFVSLPKSETEDFLVEGKIKEKFDPNTADVKHRQQDQANSKINYAKEKEFLDGLTSKLDYFSLQKERHPYIRELRDYANQ